MNARKASQDVAKLREWRVWGGPRWGIAREVGDAAADVQRRARAGTAVERAWLSVAPVELLERVVSVALVRGVLTVRAADSGARFEVDRWLRCGGEAKLVRAAGVSIRKIRLA
jgi:hypothetical protein